ncbi:MAG: hypothetical protein Kow00109_27620 [Acidobacteriota bacterium]
MTRDLAVLLVVTLSLLGTALLADPLTVTDGYVGAQPTHSSYNGADVIGNSSVFDIAALQFFRNGDEWVFRVITPFPSHVGTPAAYGAILGDLFLSTDGWNPYGTAPYAGDNSTNGESWEYVLRRGDGGLAHLYQVLAGGIQLSDDYFDSSHYIFRAGQEVRYAPLNGQSALKTGSWTGTAEYLEFRIDPTGTPLAGATQLGFHWTMSCGNDVIEGLVAVPEPGVLTLLAGGLLGVLAAGARRAAR